MQQYFRYLALLLAAVIVPSHAYETNPSAVDILPSDPPCTVIFNQHSCFDRNLSPSQIYHPSAMRSTLDALPKAYGDIPSTPCIDLQRAEAPYNPTRPYNANNCMLTTASVDASVDIACPHVPAGQFWVTNQQCALHAIEVFDQEGCRGSSYYWDMKYMHNAPADKVIKDGVGQAWCAGPGKNLGMPVMIKSFRLLQGAPLPEPSGICHGGKCNGGWWPGS